PFLTVWSYAGTATHSPPHRPSERVAGPWQLPIPCRDTRPPKRDQDTRPDEFRHGRRGGVSHAFPATYDTRGTMRRSPPLSARERDSARMSRFRVTPHDLPHKQNFCFRRGKLLRLEGCAPARRPMAVPLPPRDQDEGHTGQGNDIQEHDVPQDRGGVVGDAVEDEIGRVRRIEEQEHHTLPAIDR